MAVSRILAALCGLATSGAALSSPPAPPLSSYVMMTQEGPAARAIMDGGQQCPSVIVDGVSLPMATRAGAADIAQRQTKSKPENSMPSRFPVRVCEAVLPAGARGAAIMGTALPLPPARVKRIVVIGDTGCRIKASDNAAQSCNDPAAWPFARVTAQAAAWKPDLVLHVGDYLYRENPCPEGRAGCAGTVWGYGWDAWDADFFTPARPLLATAPWIMVRGNHESCLRAGQGWWRFLDARPLIAGRDCDLLADDARGDEGNLFVVPLGKGAQILAMDLAIAGEDSIDAADPRFGWMTRMRDTLVTLTRGHVYSFATDHYPLLGLKGGEKAGRFRLTAGNPAILSTFGTNDPTLALPGVDMLLAGHVHEWQQADYADHPGQFISGMGGTQEDVTDIPIDKAIGAEPAPGVPVKRFDIWTKGFGFMTLERTGARRWRAEVHALDGGIIRRCRIDGRRSSCKS